MTVRPSKRIERARRVIAAILTAALLPAFTPAAVSADAGDPKYVTFYTLAVQTVQTAGGTNMSIAIPELYCRLAVDNRNVANPGTPGPVLNAGTPNANAGYGAFIGWYTAPQGDAKAKPFGFSGIAENTDVFAHFRKDALLSFLDGDGDVFLTKSVPIGESAVKAEPSKAETAIFDDAAASKVFSYWKDAESGGPYNFNTVLNKDIILAPVFKESTSYYVSFYSEGTQVPFQTVTQGGTATGPAAPTRAGYTFSGWTRDKEGQTPFDFNTAINANTTLYAQWTGQTVGYTVMLWNEKAGIDVASDSGDYEYYGQYGGYAATAGMGLTSVTDQDSAADFKSAITAAIT
ncbi:MAG: InlB B-repeat-containing protein, partial [Clostridiales Family XIII bacterium]|nr:InlB B-repeat-containing protein [Clostridiales Family XIII bacterium]